MDYTETLSECNTVAIYLGNTCNFNCVYCDREYIANSVGGQALGGSSIDHLENFFTQLYKESKLNIERIALHGGEPFLFVKRMDQILDRLKPFIDQYNLEVVITTNGSLLLENQEFLEKWKSRLKITISYDFIFQEENRDTFDVDATGKMCMYLGIPILWQFVMPLTDSRVFSLDLVKDILAKVKYSSTKYINLIPLRHHRGETKFKDFFDEINIPQFFDAFTKFINTLYNYNVNVVVDGAYNKIDKNYLGKHYKIILGPDGFIYPEYDFCEYKRKEFRVGQWYNNSVISVSQLSGYQPVIEPPANEDLHIQDKCKECSSRHNCGIKYLYKMFDEQPRDKCALFYKVIEATVDYTVKIKAKKGFYNWIGPLN
jgi:sulfatase maturation enzyme AslB (radical SAM superfamily)